MRQWRGGFQMRHFAQPKNEGLLPKKIHRSTHIIARRSQR
jgi:hypothetical protein